MQTQLKVLVAAAAFVSPQMASAALLVNETYDNYVPYNFETTGAGYIAGPASNAFGLTGSYYINNAGGSGGFSFEAGGLAFASYNSASGGKFVYRSNTGGATLAAQVNLTSSVGSTLYTSFLFRTITRGTITTGETGSLTELRVGTDVNTTGGNSRFRSELDAAGVPNDGYGVGYTGGTVTGTTTLPDLNVTYMAISRFTGLGVAPTVGAPATATMYILTEAQYINFVAAGYTQAFLDGAGNVTTKVENSVTSGSAVTLSNGNFVQLGGIGTTSGVTHFDALKFATTLQEAVTIPEPSALGLSALGLLGVLRRRRA